MISVYSFKTLRLYPLLCHINFLKYTCFCYDAAYLKEFLQNLVERLYIQRTASIHQQIKGKEIHQLAPPRKKMKSNLPSQLVGISCMTIDIDVRLGERAYVRT